MQRLLHAPHPFIVSDIAPFVVHRHNFILQQVVDGAGVNVVLLLPIGLSVADLEALGVRRVSVGGALARAAWGGFLRAATEIAERGTFEALADAAPHATLQKFFASGTDPSK